MLGLSDVVLVAVAVLGGFVQVSLLSTTYALVAQVITPGKTSDQMIAVGNRVVCISWDKRG